jgi:hypothetical protein
MFEQRSEIYCIEHSLSADDSLAFILDHHQTQRGWILSDHPKPATDYHLKTGQRK